MIKARSINDFERHWGLRQPPNFGDLDFSKEADVQAFVQRNEDVQVCRDMLERWQQVLSGKIGLIGGAPGVGKSTFVKYLAHTTDNAHYFSLFDYSHAFIADHEEKLSDHRFLEIGAGLESIIANSGDSLSLVSRLPEMEAQDSSDYVDEVVANILVSAASQIGSAEMRILFVDNVDFITIFDQFRLIRVLSKLVRSSSNIVVVLVGRPLLISLARSFHREFIGSSAHVLRQLGYLKTYEILNARFDAVKDGNLPIVKDSAGKILDSFVDGNVALALKVAVDMYFYLDDVVPANQWVIDGAVIENSLFGKSLVRLDGVANVNLSPPSDFGFLQDIFQRFKRTDRVPPVYLMLDLLKSPRTVSADFVDSFNSIIRTYDPQSPRYSVRDVLNLVDVMRMSRLVRRVHMEDISAFVRNLSQEDFRYRSPDYDYVITRTGAYLSSLSRTQRYRTAAEIDSYPTGYRNYILENPLPDTDVEGSTLWNLG